MLPVTGIESDGGSKMNEPGVPFPLRVVREAIEAEPLPDVLRGDDIAGALRAWQDKLLARVEHASGDEKALDGLLKGRELQVLGPTESVPLDHRKNRVMIRVDAANLIQWVSLGI